MVVGAGQEASHRLGRYELISRLAVGGMAELFVARAQAMHGFEKIVALKRIIPSFAEDADFVRMFLAEARLAATLQHPNIAQVYDVGEERGAYFFAMEYVLGQDLRRVVRAVRSRDQWLTLDHIIQVVAGTAAALHYAHEKEDKLGRPLGIVHRDVSPSNILISYDGGVKLVDFGIARATALSEATTTGAIKGKIPYMSPEQCRGATLDRRSDIFSLGVILWELACCRRLFVGDNDLALAQRIASEDAPRPSSILPNFSPDLEAIIMRALDRDPARRYATAQDFQVDLEEFARERKLALSSVTLGRFMHDLFADVIAEQRAAVIAASAGRSTVFPELEASASQVRPIGGVAAEALGAPVTAADKVVSRPPRSTLALGIGAGMALAAAAVAAWVLLAARSEPAAAPASAPPEPAASTTPAAPDPASAAGAGAAHAAADDAAAPAGGAGEADTTKVVEAPSPAPASTEETPAPRPRSRATSSRRRGGATGKSSHEGRADAAQPDPIAGELKDPFAAPSK